MTERSRFTHAISNPSVRRDIARAVQSGNPVEQLAAEFDISRSTVRAYTAEWKDAQRTIRQLDSYERESIIRACRRGGRRRWVRELGADAVRELLGGS